MLHAIVMSVLLACAPFGALDAYPQHRFGGMPVQFSFRTVHTPANFPQTRFSSRPSRLTLTPAQPEQPAVAPTVPDPVPAQSHIPVMVSVPNDFVGDSIVVTSDDLNKMGLNGASAMQKSIADPVIAEEAPPAVELAPEPKVEAVFVEEAPAGPLSEVDESFVLTASEPQPEGLDVMPSDPVDIVAEPAPELISSNSPVIESEMPVEPESFVAPVESESVLDPEPIAPLTEPLPTPTVSPIASNPFHAYNQFLKTWLQLASVNLNRPDLLNLIAPVNEPSAAVPQPEETAIAEPITPTSVPDESQPFVPLDTSIAEAAVVENVQEVVSEAPIDVTTDLSVIVENEPTTPADTFVRTQNIVEATSEPIPVEETVVEEVVLPISEAAPVPIPEEINTNSIVEHAAVNEAIMPAAPEVAASPVLSPQPDPSSRVLQTVPRYTSRGRLAGFSYSFSHVPRRGTFFLHQRGR